MKKIEEILKNKIVDIILMLIYTISFVMFTLFLINVADYKFYKFGVVLNTIIGLYTYKYIKHNLVNEIKNKPYMRNILLALFSIYLFILLFVIKRHIRLFGFTETMQNEAFNIYRIRFVILGIFACVSLGVVFFNKIINHFTELYNSMSAWDKKAYAITSIIGSLIICILYISNNNWFLQYDKVFSIDSGYVVDEMINKPEYSHIRHPLFGLSFYPIYAVVYLLTKLIQFPPYATLIISCVLYQIVNYQFLVLSGMYLKKITENKNIYIMYMLSFATLTYMLLLEKCNIIVYFFVLYIYLLVKNKNRSGAFTFAIGNMPTAIYIIFAEMFNKNTVLEKLKNILKIAIVGLMIVIASGKVYPILNGGFKSGVDSIPFEEQLTKTQKLNSTLNLVHSSIISIPTHITGWRYNFLWQDVFKVPYLTYCLLGIMVIGALAKRKEVITKISVLSMVFLGILFGVLKWSVHESPLFNIYFSWSVVVLLVQGIDYIIQKLKLNKYITYTLIYTYILTINLYVLIQIGIYLNSIKIIPFVY